MILYAFLITIMFLLSGIHKFQDFKSTVNGFMNKTGSNNNVSTLAILFAMVLQIAASSIIMYESYYDTGKYRKIAKFSCFALAGFTIGATLIYHYPPTGKTYYPFISNVTTFGALLLLAKNFENG